MSINVKKYTKDQMAKMVEEAVERCESLKSENADLVEKVKKEMAEKLILRNYLMAMTHSHENLKAKNVALVEQLDQMNGEAINKANEIANLKAEADALRNKLADTEATLRRANDELAFKGTVLNVMRDGRYNAEQRADYAEAHPWRNLWAWVKRKLVRHE